MKDLEPRISIGSGEYTLLAFHQKFLKKKLKKRKEKERQSKKKKQKEKEKEKKKEVEPLPLYNGEEGKKERS